MLATESAVGLIGLDHVRSGGSEGTRGGLEHGQVGRNGLPLSRADPLLDVVAAEVLLCVQANVDLAPEAKIGELVASAERLGLDVIQLEESARRAPVPFDIEVRALFSVASEDLALNRQRDVAAARRRLVVRR